MNRLQRLFGHVRRPTSLTGQLSVALSLIVIAAVGLVLLLLSMRLEAAQDTLLDRSLEWQAKDIALHLTIEDGRAELDLPENLAKAYAKENGQFLYLISGSDGAPIFHSRKGMLLAGHPPELKGDASQYFQFRDVESGQTFYGITMPFVVSGRSFVIQTAQGPAHSDVLIDELIDEYFEKQWWVFLIFIIAIIGTVVLTVRRALRPVDQVARVARELGPASLDVRLETDGLPSDVLPIVDAVNVALRRIEDGYRRQREFTSNVAHQLRTPLTILRADMERNDFRRDDALAEILSMERLVQQFLHLAQADNLSMTSDEVADLKQVAEDTVAALAPQAVKAGKEIELRVADGAFLIRGNASFIGVALRNLIENALRYSGEGKRIIVDLAAPAVLSVSDEGPGLLPEERERIFNRFWRGSRRVEDGAGLGLSIVAQILQVHGGTVGVENGMSCGAVFLLDFSESIL